MTEGSTKKPRRQRRSFTDEFKAGAVSLVLDKGKTIAEVARDLDLVPSGLSVWVEQARADKGKSARGTLTTDEKSELAQLRKEVRELRVEREILENFRAFAGDLLDVKLPGGTVALTEGSGRQLFGDVEPDKKHGPGMVADLRVVTPVRRSRLGK